MIPMQSAPSDTRAPLLYRLILPITCLVMFAVYLLLFKARWIASSGEMGLQALLFSSVAAPVFMILGHVAFLNKPVEQREGTGIASSYFVRLWRTKSPNVYDWVAWALFSIGFSLFGFALAVQRLIFDSVAG